MFLNIYLFICLWIKPVWSIVPKKMYVALTSFSWWWNDGASEMLRLRPWSRWSRWSRSRANLIPGGHCEYFPLFLGHKLRFEEFPTLMRNPWKAPPKTSTVIYWSLLHSGRSIHLFIRVVAKCTKWSVQCSVKNWSNFNLFLHFFCFYPKLCQSAKVSKNTMQHTCSPAKQEVRLSFQQGATWVFLAPCAALICILLFGPDSKITLCC